MSYAKRYATQREMHAASAAPPHSGDHMAAADGMHGARQQRTSPRQHSKMMPQRYYHDGGSRMELTGFRYGGGGRGAPQTPPPRHMSSTKRFYSPDVNQPIRSKSASDAIRRGVGVGGVASTSTSPRTTRDAPASPAGSSVDPITQTQLQQLIDGHEHIRRLSAEQSKREEELFRLVADMAQRAGSFQDSESGIHHHQQQHLVEERDRAVHLLRTFKHEGDAIVCRLYNSLKKQAAENERLTSSVEDLSNENKRLYSMMSSSAASSAVYNKNSTSSGVVKNNNNKSVLGGNDDNNNLLIDQLDQKVKEQQISIQELKSLLRCSEEVMKSMKQKLNAVDDERRRRAEGDAKVTATARAFVEASYSGLLARYPHDADVERLLSVLTSWSESISRLETDLASERAQRVNAEDASAKIAYESSRMLSLLEARLQRSEAARGMPFIPSLRHRMGEGNSPVSSSDRLARPLFEPQLTPTSTSGTPRRTPPPSVAAKSIPLPPRIALNEATPFGSLQHRGALHPQSATSRSPSMECSRSSERRVKSYVGEILDEEEGDVAAHTGSVNTDGTDLPHVASITQLPLMIPTPDPASLSCSESVTGHRSVTPPRSSVRSTGSPLRLVISNSNNSPRPLH